MLIPLLELYLYIFRNMNFVSEIHSQIADYFLGVWGGGNEKPFVYSELQRQRFHLDRSERKVYQSRKIEFL